MIVIGLTGSMASGKSTIAAMLKNANIPVIDADLLARRVTEAPGPVLDQIRDRFGTKVFNPDNTLNRSALGQLVFKDPMLLRDLENIIHPAIEALRSQEFEHLKSQRHKVAVYMAPLLFEKNLEPMVDKTLLVIASEQNMLERIGRRDGLSEQEARLRLASQMSMQEKIRRADVVIENNGTVDELFMQLKLVWPRLCNVELGKP